MKKKEKKCQKKKLIPEQKKESHLPKQEKINVNMLTKDTKKQKIPNNFT